MITEHQYLDCYPIDSDCKILILGTIHPHNIDKFQIPFFYGNKNSIWNLLSDAFPEELAKPITLYGVHSFLKHRKITISDTIKKCRRVKPTALDKDLIPEVINHTLFEQIRRSKIEYILCTSAFGKNNAFKLFYEEILGLKTSKVIKTNRQVWLDPTLFGRQVLIKCLYSPSGSSNVPLSKHPLYLNNREKYVGKKPVYQFKVDYYREQFSI